MAYPGCDEFEVHNLLYNLNMTEQVVVFRAEVMTMAWILSHLKAHGRE